MNWKKTAAIWASLTVPTLTWAYLITAAVSTLATEVEALKATVSELPQFEVVRNMGIDVTELKGEVKQLNTWERDNQASHSRLETGQATANAKLDSQKESIDKIESIVTKLHLPGGNGM